jgi:hypothetical protein
MRVRYSCLSDSDNSSISVSIRYSWGPDSDTSGTSFIGRLLQMLPKIDHKCVRIEERKYYIQCENIFAKILEDT